jgi:phage N-6-adenine-methyltransferase
MSTKKKKKPAKKPAKLKKGPGGPRITKGKSDGTYGTPDDFIAAVMKKFGSIVWDLAADKRNAVVKEFFSKEDDAFKQDWAAVSKKYANDIGRPGLLWLNPPFANIGPWARMALEESKKGAEIAFLVPASVGAKWFRDYCFRQADVYFLYGRLKFKGEPTVYPKDCMLVHFHPSWGGMEFKEDIWDWRKELEPETEEDKAA